VSAMVCRQCQGRGFLIHDCRDCTLRQRCDNCDGTGLLRDFEAREPDFTLDDLEWSEEHE
jgi:DnaJ-class molecular chaperone